MTAPQGPVTVSVATDRRLTLFDVPNELTAVLDIARVADLVVIVIDASEGFQTEHFEYLNILQTIGFPKVFTVLTKVDLIQKKFFKTRKQIRERVEKEIAAGCKIFEVPWIESRQSYKHDKVQTLARCIAQQRFTQPLQWKTEHGCVLVDRIEMQTKMAGGD